MTKAYSMYGKSNQYNILSFLRDASDLYCKTALT